MTYNLRIYVKEVYPKEKLSMFTLTVEELSDAIPIVREHLSETRTKIKGAILMTIQPPSDSPIDEN